MEELKTNYDIEDIRKTLDILHAKIDVIMTHLRVATSDAATVVVGGPSSHSRGGSTGDSRPAKRAKSGGGDTEGPGLVGGEGGEGDGSISSHPGRSNDLVTDKAPQEQPTQLLEAETQSLDEAETQSLGEPATQAATQESTEPLLIGGKDDDSSRSSNLTQGTPDAQNPYQTDSEDPANQLGLDHYYNIIYSGSGDEEETQL